MTERNARQWEVISTLEEWHEVMGPWATQPWELPCAVMGIETEEGVTYAVMYPQTAQALLDGRRHDDAELDVEFELE